MLRLMLPLLVGLVTLAAPEPIPSESAMPSALSALLSVFDDKKVSNVEQAAKILQEKFGEGFTGTPSSSSNQPGSRLLTFGKDGEIVVGFNATSKTLEIVVDTNSRQGILPYQLYFDKKDAKTQKPYTLVANPTRCTECHGKHFTYIFDPYRKWPHFFGENDDKIDPKDKQFEAFRSDERFRPFFATPRAARPSFPYWSTNDERNLGAMPNTRLSMLLNVRAARSVHHRLRGQFPDRYERVKFLLVAEFLCQNPALDKDKELVASRTAARDSFETRFKSDNPSLFEKWEAIQSIKSKTDKNILRILHYLGVAPDSIFLTKRLKKNGNPLESPAAFDEFWKQYPVDSEELKYDEAGPLAYYDGQASLGWHLAELVGQDLPPASRRSAKDYQDPKEIFEGAQGNFDFLKSFKYTSGPYSLTNEATYCPALWKVASEKLAAPKPEKTENQTSSPQNEQEEATH